MAIIYDRAAATVKKIRKLSVKSVKRSEMKLLNATRFQ